MHAAMRAHLVHSKLAPVTFTSEKIEAMLGSMEACPSIGTLGAERAPRSATQASGPPRDGQRLCAAVCGPGAADLAVTSNIE